MLRSRPQFTLKAVLVVIVFLSIGFALVKYEHDAAANFMATATAVSSALDHTESAVDEELYQRWLHAVGSNPTYAANEWSSRMVLGNAGSNEAISVGTIVSSRSWNVVRMLPSPAADFSRLPVSDEEKHVDAQVICSRPWGMLFLCTTVEIIKHPALDNSLFVDRLQAELERAGIQFKVVIRP